MTMTDCCLNMVFAGQVAGIVNDQNVMDVVRTHYAGDASKLQITVEQERFCASQMSVKVLLIRLSRLPIKRPSILVGRPALES